MLNKKNENVNKVVLDDQNNKISNQKLLLLILVGIVGLYVYGLIGQAIISAIPGLSQGQANGAINFICYGLLFVTILGVLNKDVIKLKNSFKSWKPYVGGIIIGFIIVAIQLGYSNLVNLFYHSKVSDNEDSLRSFISIYPALSIIFLCFIGPMCEEITYRVSLFGIFGNKKILGYIVSVLIFSLMHFNPLSGDIVNELVNLPLYLLSAIGLTYSYDRFGLAGSYCSHCLNNLWSVIGILIVTNLG